MTPVSPSPSQGPILSHLPKALRQSPSRADAMLARREYQLSRDIGVQSQSPTGSDREGARTRLDCLSAAQASPEQTIPQLLYQKEP